MQKNARKVKKCADGGMQDRRRHKRISVKKQPAGDKNSPRAALFAAASVPRAFRAFPAFSFSVFACFSRPLFSPFLPAPPAQRGGAAEFGRASSLTGGAESATIRRIFSRARLFPRFLAARLFRRAVKARRNLPNACSVRSPRSSAVAPLPSRPALPSQLSRRVVPLSPRAPRAALPLPCAARRRSAPRPPCAGQGACTKERRRGRGARDELST